MYCMKCGNQLKEIDRFCGKCGASIEAMLAAGQAGMQGQTGQNATIPNSMPQNTMPSYTHQVYVVKKETSGICKVSIIIMAIVEIIMCLSPWAVFNYWFDEENFTVFEVTEYLLKLTRDSSGSRYALVSFLMIVAYIAVIVGIVGNAMTVFKVAGERETSKHNIKVTNIALIIGSACAFFGMTEIADITYGLIEPKVVVVWIFIISIIQLIVSTGIHYGDGTQVMRRLVNQQDMSQQLIGQDKWRCIHCGCINQNYVGTCACGHTREESLKSGNK